MTLAEHPSLQACPACATAPAAEALAGRGGAGEARLDLSLPTIHCAACISGVERALLAVPGVADARVNLTQKRARIRADDSVTPEALVEALTAAGYEAHELDPGALAATTGDAASRDLLMRLGVAGFAMMNVMLLSVAVWSGASDATRDLFHWISAAIAIPTIAFSAQPFFRNALRALGAARLNMDVPISLAILLAAGMSIFETAEGGSHAYFDAALSLTFFLLGGRYLDQRTRTAARSAAAELSALEVPRATRITGETVPVAALLPGDLLLVRPGARVPVDGTVTEGTSEVDRALLTGESLPDRAGPGAELHAGEINLTGPLTLKVTYAGKDTTLARLADLVAMAETAKSRYASLADRAARIYAPAVHLLAFAAFAGWMWATGDVRLALNIAVATLIITCPCALGLAVPAVSTAASGRLFRQGLLIKHATALERLAEVDTIVFDKTGTLTEGHPVLSGHDADDEAAAVARALAAASSHPLAMALHAGLWAAPAAVSDIREVPGHGIEGTWQGRTVRLGRADWLGAPMGGGTATWLAMGDAAPVAFHFVDTLREGASETVAALRDRGYAIHLLSGDTEDAVASLAAATGIEHWQAAIRPDEKATFIEGLTANGHRVLMVGDGLNDTAALASAHVSISPASALDAARTVSDMVLLGRALTPITDAIATAKNARRRILENFGIAATYNAISIPLALAGLATPLAAALAMSTSSILVTLNALRLR
ncbi:cadmium-translocating P-type ATPase [Alphaproteobacteria bacterium GH1-50]|uniref:Cadmium-translocating P-type ATPase n=1 Tax=Kangsaoukella pontilimi TaxID=2691042 RepID=A0A7C9IHT1_9RHOB|nr:heavy metal translocating P-type ATPase [Kangsaoukella pontilimi]MXQ09204.1 cadmium-translocating P-type ATPase [Kangsaoukella pontilimi]